MPDLLDAYHRCRSTYESHLRRANQAADFDSRESMIEAVREFSTAAGQAELLAVLVHDQPDLCRTAFTSPAAWQDAAQLDRAFAIERLGALVDSFQVEALSDFMAEAAC